MSVAAHREVVLVHSSDLHLGTDNSFGSSCSSDALSVLRGVLVTATAVRADLLILAGDTFDHNRQPSALLDRAARIMGEFCAPIVILPGNHDPLTPDSVYRRAELGAPSNVCVLGLTIAEAAVFPGLGIEVWGRAHLDYSDMSPLVKPRSRSTRWQLAVAHGHYVEELDDPGRFLGSWLIRRDDLIATGADYVALGHWNTAARVGDKQINAYYSGSPDYVGTVNVVRLQRDGAVEVTRIGVTH
ncbi:MAG: metallophosphoesterase [Deltaproteobacteria bacterium]|nr:metallophosphoesterase [Deltaproteobacteria bacterium]